MNNKTLIAASAGVFSGFAATAFINQTPGAIILVYMADLPLFLTGFAFGSQSVLICGLAGFITVSLLGGGLAAAMFVLVQAIPTWLVTRLMLLQRPISVIEGETGTKSKINEVEWYPVGDLICWLSIIVAGLLIIASLTSVVGGYGSLSSLISDNLSQILQTMTPEWNSDQRKRIVDLMVPMFPGAMGISWLIMTIFNAVLAQNILSKFNKSIRPTPEYIDLQLPQWISWPIVASCALALLGTEELDYTGRNLAMILSLPLFFLGLTVVHTWTRGLQSGGAILLAFFYFVLILSSWTTLIVAGLGLLELWNGIRFRMIDASKKNDLF